VKYGPPNYVYLYAMYTCLTKPVSLLFATHSITLGRHLKDIQ